MNLSEHGEGVFFDYEDAFSVFSSHMSLQDLFDYEAAYSPAALQRAGQVKDPAADPSG